MLPVWVVCEFGCFRGFPDYLIFGGCYRLPRLLGLLLVVRW